MIKQRSFTVIFLLILLLMTFSPLAAQDNELVAALEVLSSGVQVKRINTSIWVPINVETLIGQGDSVRTDGTGSAIITFFEDGSDVELTANTEYKIVEFAGDEEEFTLTVEVLAGITRQQFQKLINPGSSYQVITPGAAMTVRGTNFDIRVEGDGRSSVLTRTGLVAAAAEGADSEVPPGFGLRSAVDAPLSEVVPATTFEELDIALDGCASEVITDADVRLNVRLGPGTSYERIGSIEPAEITNLIGVMTDKSWYRLRFQGGYGWISSTGMTITLDEACLPLRQFDSTQVEDATLYGLVGDQNLVVQVTATTANLRSGPGLGYRRVALAYTGDELTIIGRNGDTTWLRVITADGQTAWIAASLVDVTTDLNQVGVVPVDEIQPEPTEAGDESSAETTPTPAASE